MEQLKPLLKHKFWIIFGIALVLPIVGWFLATGQANERIDERITKISGTNVSSGSSAANDQWNEKLTEINKREEQRLNDGARYLWQQQKALMVWHPQLRSLVGNLAYRDPIPEQALNWYSSLYESEFDRIRKIVRPYDFETDRGIVNVPIAALQIHPNYSAWKSNPGLLKSEEMWDAQEDIWLLEALLRAIDSTNRLASATSITDAYVRQIDQITLLGGSRATGEGSATTGGYAGGSSGGAMDGGYAEQYSEGAAGGSGYGGDTEGYGGGGGASVNVSFDPAEEFGSDAITTATTSSPGQVNAAASDANYSEGYGGGGLGQERRRYIDNEGLPFRTRGFYMELVIDHTKLPELLGELSSLPWPVEIVRVQQGEYASSGGSSGGSMPRSGGFAGGAGGNPFMRGTQSMGPMGPMGGGTGYRRPGGAFGGGGPFGGRPMGTMGPMGPVGPMGNRSPMGRGPMGNEQKRRGEKFSAAMQDPVLARVAIAGLLTLFESPENIDPGDGFGAAPQSTATPGTPADPAATPPDGTPVDPAAPADPADPAAPAPAADPTAPSDGAVAPPDVTEGAAPSADELPDAAAPESTPPSAVPDPAPAATDNADPVEDPAAAPGAATPPTSPGGAPETPAEAGAPPAN